MEVHRSFQQFLASAVERTHHSHKHMARNSRQRGNVESVTVSLVFGHNRESLVLVRTVFWPALSKSPGFLWSQQHEWRSASVPLNPFKCGGGPLLVIFGLKTFLGIFHHLSNSLGGQKIKTLTALLSNPPKPLTGPEHTARHAIGKKAPQRLEKFRRAMMICILLKRM